MGRGIPQYFAYPRGDNLKIVISVSFAGIQVNRLTPICARSFRTMYQKYRNEGLSDVSLKGPRKTNYEMQKCITYSHQIR